MKLTEDQKAKLTRVLVNTIIIFAGAGGTAALQFISQQDWGSWSVPIAATISTLIKVLQSWYEPAQDVYRT